MACTVGPPNPATEVKLLFPPWPRCSGQFMHSSGVIWHSFWFFHFAFIKKKILHFLVLHQVEYKIMVETNFFFNKAEIKPIN